MPAMSSWLQGHNYDKLFNNYDWENMPLLKVPVQELQCIINDCFNAGMLLQQESPPEIFLHNIEKITYLLKSNKKESIIFDILNLANTKLAKDGEIMAKACQEQGQSFVCHKGCAGCCHHLVMCDASEALLIVAYLNAHAQLKAVFINNYAIWDIDTHNFRASYIAWAKELYTNGHDNKAHSLEDYNQACPFLSAQNTCSIYMVRPYACRSTISVNSSCCTKQEGTYGKHTMQYSLYTGHHLVRKSIMQLCNNILFSTDGRSMPEIVYNIINQTK